MSTLNDPTWDNPTGRHPVNVGHLVMGVAFVGLVTIWALNISGAVTGSSARFLFPLPWVAAGIAGLIASTVSKKQRAEERRREATRHAAWVEEQAQLSERWAMPDPTATSSMPTTPVATDPGGHPDDADGATAAHYPTAPPAAESDSDHSKDDLR